MLSLVPLERVGLDVRTGGGTGSIFCHVQSQRRQSPLIEGKIVKQIIQTFTTIWVGSFQYKLHRTVENVLTLYY